MGMRFRKSIKLGKHVRINLSKSGIGYSAGTKGYRVTKMANGRTRTTTSIPGSGISYVRESKTRSVSSTPHTYDPGVVSVPANTSAPRLSTPAALAITAAIVILIFAIFSWLDSPSARDTDSPPVTSVTRLSFSPLDPLTISQGDYIVISVTHDQPIPMYSLSVVSDAPEIATAELVSVSDYHTKFAIIGEGVGTCYIRAEYGNLFSAPLSVTVTEPVTYTDPTAGDDIPPSPVYYFIVNKNTKVIHRASCSRAPAGGEYTTDYSYYAGNGYTHCSYCFY